ncbi:MAG: response regulator [SAR324 cluster bacterium]|nr:response regulator [SAR324 cluster bacterium]
MKRILVVEDNKTFQKVIHNLLIPVSSEITLAKNGIEGVRLAVRHSPQIITVDLDMPILDGITMIKILSMIGVDPHAIVVSAKAEDFSAIKQIPNVAKVLHKNDIKISLKTEVELILEKFKKKPFADFSYRLRPSEFAQFYTARDRKKVLLVSGDDKFITEAKHKLLGLNMFEVYVASTGKEGLLKALGVKPDVIYCDQEAKELSGLQLAQTLFVLGHPFPLVILTPSQDDAFEQNTRIMPAVRDFYVRDQIFEKGISFLKSVTQNLKQAEELESTLAVIYKRVDIDAIQASGGLVIE